VIRTFQTPFLENLLPIVKGLSEEISIKKKTKIACYN
jgi:hypothetical protein